MNHRKFNHTDFSCAEIGLGCWQLGGGDWGEVSDEQAFDILAQAVDLGVNFFDTADVYGGGRSETLIGRFLKSTPAEVFVATKLGRLGIYPDKYTEATVRAATEESLRRLQTEALDLTQLHCIPTEVMRQGEVFDWLRTLKQEGKIKSFGASVESMEEALICLEQDGLSSLQIIFNVFRQKPIAELFAAAKAKSVALIVRLPLASGLLGGKLTKQSGFAAGDHRNYNRDGQFFNVGETFAGLPFETGVELADELRQLVPEDMTMAQWAMRWILDYDAVTVVIPGATKPQQVADNIAVSQLPPLGEEVHRRLQAFYQEKVVPHIRGPY
ncbi:MAG TPA: aldo/keto reductase [Blastocatellia bacterium]|nr:aldo/keto reductase [Blastocatellia bacterium]HMX25719.1 aldo/keto reductase [Blastocatellia bacterium]HMY71418.1 aldo/keto reductase [Blastocatellia bacterium]HNG31683.1 aldo/keto reductase [Blastocatellia bacterium]